MSSCPYCRKSVAITAKYCPFCGKRIDSRKQVESTREITQKKSAAKETSRWGILLSSIGGVMITINSLRMLSLYGRTGEIFTDIIEEMERLAIPGFEGSLEVFESLLLTILSVMIAFNFLCGFLICVGTILVYRGRRIGGYMIVVFSILGIVGTGTFFLIGVLLGIIGGIMTISKVRKEQPPSLPPQPPPLSKNVQPQFLYNKLLEKQRIYGDSKQVLEHKIESLMKQGLSREEVILKLALKEKLVKEE